MESSACFVSFFDKENAPQCTDRELSIKTPGRETKSGDLLVSVNGQARTRCQRRLRVVVYGNGLEPFAVFYQEKKFCNYCGYLKLRKCRLVKTDDHSGGDCSFMVTSKSGDGNWLTLTAQTQAERDDWMAALQTKPVSIRRRANTTKLSNLEQILEDEASGDDDVSKLKLSTAEDTVKTKPPIRRRFSLNVHQG